MEGHRIVYIKNFGFKKPFLVETTCRFQTNRQFHFHKYEKAAKKDFKELNRRLEQC